MIIHKFLIQIHHIIIGKLKNPDIINPLGTTPTDVNLSEFPDFNKR